jgi:hypothetical protein
VCTTSYDNHTCAATSNLLSLYVAMKRTNAGANGSETGGNARYVLKSYTIRNRSADS